MRLEERKEIIKTSHSKLSVNRQLKLLSVPHSSYYYCSKKAEARKQEDAHVKDRMLNIYMNKPFYGVLRMTAELQQDGLNVNHKRVNRLHKELGLETIYPHPKRNTSQKNPENPIYPYLLRDVKIERINQVWSTDITYTKVNGNKAFVIAIIDWHSRMVLAHKTVNTMDTYHCIEVLEMAISKFGKPEIFNSDQGSQFTSKAFTDELKKRGIRISMDGRGRCRDNARMERFWWSLKVENLYINSYQSMEELRNAVNQYVQFYNTQRLHSSLGYRTPSEVYRTSNKGKVA